MTSKNGTTLMPVLAFTEENDGTAGRPGNIEGCVD
jgi:hypothetical protein